MSAMNSLYRTLLFIFLTTSLHGQVTRDFAIDLKADVSPTIPHITLSWTLRQAINITAQQVYRRLKGESLWVSQATLTVADTTWADATALPGAEYEYWMRRTYSTISPNTAIGYIAAGYQRPMVEARGKVLLVIDETMVAPLNPEIDELRRDLIADGWSVQVIQAARRDTLTDATAAADTKALIKAAYDSDPSNVKHVYILGHVPVPYSGSQAPDGHGNHSGAWSADGFYGDMDGTWTDTSVTNTSSSETRIHNVPGDGKLDQNSIPSPLELAVGRVDLRNMQRAPASTVPETALLRRYLKKAHDFKYKQGAYANLERRVLIRDGFGAFGSESFMRSGWAWGFTTVGRPPEVTYDEAPSGNWWTQAAANAYLMANGNGGGSYETCGSVGATVDFGRRPFRAAFVSLFGSYFGDWDVTNNFMKAPLAGNATGDGLGLCCFWAGRPTFFMHSMSMGETLGFSIRQSMNSQFSAVSNPIYTPINFPGGGTHLGLMGDPTLRMHVVEPPRNLMATSASGSVTLAWSASAEPNVLGYHVYRSNSADGPFVRLSPSPLATPLYTDSTVSAGSPYTYMVRTLKMENSPGGTYENLSQGEMVTTTARSTPSGVPYNPTSLAVTQQSSTSAQLTWIDNASDETSYRVERRNGPEGSFSTLANLPSGANNHTDPGPFTNHQIYYYRVIALNAVGNSAPTGEASFEAVPGYFEFNDTVAKVNKNVGIANIAVKRFGGRNGAVTVNYATSNTSAIAGTHYTGSSGTLSWEDGEEGIQNISIPIENTVSAQAPKQFRITLSSPSAGTGVGTYNAVSVLIEDPTATLTSPWQQGIVGSITQSSPGVEAEGGLSSTTIGGSGLATAATSESGQFIYQTRSGDGVLTAFVPAASPAQTGARYAVMIRESVSGGSMMAATSTSTTTGDGTKLAYRATASATSTFSGGVTAQVAPRWIRITRAGNSFTSESSSNGTTWNSHGTANVPMASTALWGLFHHSDDRSGTTYSGSFQVAAFQNVAFGTISGPGAPGTLTFTQPNPTRVSLSWGAAPLAAGYRVERSTENGTFSQLVDLPGGTLTFNDDHAAADTAYEYRVYAFNSSGNSPVSNVVRVVTSPSDVLVLLESDLASNADATVKGGNPSANFGADSLLAVSGLSSTGTTSTTAKSYFRFDVSGLPTLKSATLRLTVATVRDLSLTGFNYTGQLRFLPDSADGWTEGGITWTNAPLNNIAGNSFLTGTTLVSTLTVNSTSVPEVGSVIGLDASATQINANKGANNLVTFAMNSTTPTATIEFASKEHPSLPPPALELIYASPLPKRPSFSAVTEGVGSTLELAWTDNSSNETGFEIQRREAGGSFALLINLAANAVAHSDSATVNGVHYEYRVRATGAEGPSAWSLVSTATAGGSTGPLPGATVGFTSWMRDAHQLAPHLAAANGDADDDGLPNLIEYAQGTPATISTAESPTPGETWVGNQRFMTLTFQRRLGVTDVNMSIEASSDLTGAWTAIDPLQPENQVQALLDHPSLGWETITVRDQVPVTTDSHRFMRLRVTAK